MIPIPASLRSDFIHIPGTLIHIALESTIHIIGISKPTTSDFKRLERFVEVWRKIYEKCYKQIRDKRYAHKQRMDMSAIFAQTNTRELARLVTDLSKLHRVVWDWYRNGVKPRTSHLRGRAGNEIQKRTLKFLQSLL